ncbi:MAG: hypothetical protein ABIL02_07300, partial [candidate division WOR-3 bacterium]
MLNHKIIITILIAILLAIGSSFAGGRNDKDVVKMESSKTHQGLNTEMLLSQVPTPKSKEEQERLEQRQKEINEKSERARNEALRLIQLGQEGLIEFKKDKEKYIYTAGSSGYDFIAVLGKSKEPVAKEMLLEIAIDTTLWDMVRSHAMCALGKKALSYSELLKVIGTVGLSSKEAKSETQRGILINSHFDLIRTQVKRVKDRKVLTYVLNSLRKLVNNIDFSQVDIVIDIVTAYPMISETEKTKIILQIDSLCLACGWRGLREKYAEGMIPHIPLFGAFKFRLKPDALPYLKSFKTNDKELQDIIYLARCYLGDTSVIDTIISLALNSKNKLIRYHAINDVLSRNNTFNSSLIPVFEQALSDS